MSDLARVALLAALLALLGTPLVVMLHGWPQLAAGIVIGVVAGRAAAALIKPRPWL